MTDNLARQPQLKVIVGKTQPLPPQNKQQNVIAAEIIPELTNARPPDHARNKRRLVIHPDTARWITSAALVLLVYAAPITWWLIPDNSPGTVAPPPAAMIVELAPLPVAPPSPPDMPPGPEQAEATPPPKPEPISEPEPEPEIPPAPLATKPDVAIAPEPESKEQFPEEPPPPEPPPLEKIPEEVPPEEKPISAASAPPDALQEADTAAAPNLGVSSPAVTAQRKLTWQNALMLKLNESKQYPSLARRYRQEGVVYLRFTMDRDGNVLAKDIEQSAGYPLLDEETLELIERAQPLPKPPLEMQGDALEFVVPVEFFLRR